MDITSIRRIDKPHRPPAAGCDDLTLTQIFRQPVIPFIDPHHQIAGGKHRSMFVIRDGDLRLWTLVQSELRFARCRPFVMDALNTDHILHGRGVAQGQ